MFGLGRDHRVTRVCGSRHEAAWALLSDYRQSSVVSAKKGLKHLSLILSLSFLSIYCETVGSAGGQGKLIRTSLKETISPRAFQASLFWGMPLDACKFQTVRLPMAFSAR